MGISCQLLVRRRSEGNWTWWQLAALGVGLGGDLLRKCSNAVVARMAQVSKSGMGKVAGMVVAVGIGLRLVGNSPITLQLRVLWCPVVGGLDALQLVVAGAVGAWPAGA